jgi:Tfp pilus assembly protein FimV
MTKRQILVLIVLVAANLLIGYGVLQLLSQRANPSPPPTMVGTTPAGLSPSPSPQHATPSIIPSSTPRPDITYQVEAGDTLWDIAEKF